MEKNEQKFIVRYVVPIRILAGVLALVLLFSLVTNALLSVKLQRDGDASAAVNYLAESTEYVNGSKSERLATQLELLRTAEDMESLYNEAAVAIAREDFDTAITDIDRCIELYDEQLESYVAGDTALLSDLRLKRGCLLVLLMRYEEAEEEIDRVIRLNPELSDAYLVKAQILSEQGEAEALPEPLEAYLRLSPGDSAIRETLAQIYFGLGQYDNALAQYRRLTEEMEETGNAAEYSYMTGLSAMQTEDYETAFAFLVSAAEQGSKESNLQYYLGTTAMALENYETAAEYFSGAIGEGILRQQCLYSRAVCLLMLGGEDNAAAALEALTEAIGCSDADADEETRLQAQELLDSVFPSGETA